MVYYFTSNVVEPAAFVYVGKDKVESMSYMRKPHTIIVHHALTSPEMRI